MSLSKVPLYATTRQSYAVPDAPPASPLSSISNEQMFALARSHYENFSVLSILVPQSLRKPFAHVYWFCRTADDIADEHDGSPISRRRALDRLRDFRSLFSASLSERSKAPAEATPFTLLADTIVTHGLEPALFHQLLDAFEQDQSISRYHTIQDLLNYCQLSANPVGRIVLQLGKLDTCEAANAGLVVQSDAICTALQLANHCQDIRRDVLERDRVYIPLPSDFQTSSLRAFVQSSSREHSLYSTEARAVQAALRPVIQHSRSLFESAKELPSKLPREIATAVHVMIAGGLRIQSLIESNVDTLLWERPTVSKVTQISLVCKSLAWRATILRRSS